MSEKKPPLPRNHFDVLRKGDRQCVCYRGRALLLVQNWSFHSSVEEINRTSHRSYSAAVCFKPCKWFFGIYESIILAVVLYGCESWSQTLREEHRLRVPRRIFGPKKNEVPGDWRKLNNEGIHKLHSLPSVSRIFKRRCSDGQGM
jgi:hypothetical protein